QRNVAGIIDVDEHPQPAGRQACDDRVDDDRAQLPARRSLHPRVAVDARGGLVLDTPAGVRRVLFGEPLEWMEDEPCCS
nr:hypothetical protein [Candidatus Hydrogenedentota bacterium]